MKASGKSNVKAYELTDEEWRLVQGYREGEVPLADDGGAWVEVSRQERLAISLWRAVKFGDVVFQIKNCEPVAFRAGVQGHLDKPLIESQVILLQSAAAPPTET